MGSEKTLANTTPWKKLIQCMQMLRKGYMENSPERSEFIAIVDALKYLHDKGDSRTPVYSDSKICINWVRGRYTSSHLPLNDKTRPALNEMDDANRWLKAVDPQNPVIWWNKFTMGNCPADFNRK